MGRHSSRLSSLKTERPSLAELTDELRREFIQFQYRPHRFSRRWSQKQACLSLVVRNYGEVLVILKRLLASQERLRQLHSTIIATAFDTPREHPNKSEALAEYMTILEPITLDIKILYVWCYHIKEVFRKCEVKINAMAELQRVSLLRHAFITHAADQPMFQTATSLQAGVVFDGKCENIRIRLHPLIVKESQFVGLKGLVRSAKQYIPELKTEANYYEQLRLIYENLNNLSDAGLHKRAEKLIRRLGTVSEPPAQIVSILLKALREYKRLKRI